MGGFQPKNIIFSDLPKPTEGNFFTALGQGMDGVANVELYREAQDKKDAIEAQNALVRDEQLKSTKQQIELNENNLGDAQALKNLGNYESYDAFIKENPIANPHNVKAVQEFYDTRTTKMDAESSQAILNTLKANNGGKIPTKAQLSAQLPSLIEDKTLSNKAIGLIYQAVDTQEALELDKAYKQSGITLHNAQAQAALTKEPKTTTDPLAKEKSTYIELIKSGLVPPNQTFGEWLAESGGKVNIKHESVTNAQNQAREQLTGISNIVNSRLKDYDPSKHGPIDGPVQWIQEVMPWLKTESAGQLQSQQDGFQANVAKAMFGGKATNQQLDIAKGIAGGTINTEGGAAAQLKSALDQGILAAEETIRQIKTSKGDAKELEAELNKYKALSSAIKEWDGSQPIEIYLKTKKDATTGDGSTVRPVAKTVVGTGFDKRAGKKVVKYSDGSVVYVD